MILCHRFNVLNQYCRTELIIICVFFVPNFIGCFCFSRLICLNYKIPHVRSYTAGFTFSKLKLILLYIFGVGYMFHSGLYAWKKFSFQEDCKDNRLPDCFLEILSMIYTFIVFVYFALFSNRKLEHTVKEHYILLNLIIIVSLCIWLNAIVFESDFLYEKHGDIYNSSTTNLTISSNIAEVAIEKTHTFCSPAMVEFSLMVIDMTFADDYNTIEGSLNLQTSRDKIKFGKMIIVKIIQIALSLLVIAFFAFVFTVILITNSEDDLFDYPAYFSIYFWFELIMKVIMLFLLFKCIYKEWKYVAVSRTPFVLVFTSFCNILYHGIYCVVLFFNLDSNIFFIIPIIVNIISIALALLQTLFILVIHSEYYILYRKRHQCAQTNFVYYACYILGVFNLGLWISDSIGEDRRSVFSFMYYWAHKKMLLSIIYTAIFPVTIFFRFQTGLDFLEFFWEHETVPN